MCYLRRRLGSRREGRLVGERITDLQGCFRGRKRHLCADLLFLQSTCSGIADGMPRERDIKLMKLTVGEWGGGPSYESYVATLRH